MIRVAITDDHLLIIKGIEELLSQFEDIEFTIGFMNIEDTRANLCRAEADVLLLDLNLPDGDGVVFCKELRGQYPSLKIIALTTFNQTALVKNILQNGANGYLLKNTSAQELYDALISVMQGGQYLQADVKEALLQHTLGTTKTSRFLPTLTRREKEILQLILSEQTTQEISEKLCISVKTIETHRAHLMDKLGVRNVAGLVKIAIEKGLC